MECSSCFLNIINYNDYHKLIVHMNGIHYNISIHISFKFCIRNWVYIYFWESYKNILLYFRDKEHNFHFIIFSLVKLHLGVRLW
jgi:hypothetical protein